MLKLARQLSQKTGQFFFTWLRFFLGRHVSGIEVVENILPMGGDGIVGQLQRHFIQPELALLFFRTVATQAVFGEEWFYRFFMQGNDLLGLQPKRHQCQQTNQSIQAFRHRGRRYRNPLIHAIPDRA